MHFYTALSQRWHESNTMVCVGLDPEPTRLPAHFAGRDDAVFEFCRDIIDATAEYVCAFKPQIAHFAALSAEQTLSRLIQHIHDKHPGIPVILDAKRGDIGSTAAHYATEAFDRFQADAVTANPYLGKDSVQPYLDRADKGVIILCRTSNPGAAEFQDLLVDGKPLYLRVAERIAADWDQNKNCALVVGATWPEQLAQVRAAVGDMPILVPGVGAQGGDVQSVVSHGRDQRGAGLIISSSRAILYASCRSDFAQAAREQTVTLRDLINQFR